MRKKILLPPRLRERTEQLCATMQEMIGVDATQETRKRPVVMARVMIAKVLISEGFSLTDIGIVLGIDHATVNHYRRRMDEMLTAPGYDAERTIWDNFKQRI